MMDRTSMAVVHGMLVALADKLDFADRAPCSCGHSSLAHLVDMEPDVYAACGHHDGEVRCGCTVYTAALQ